MSDIQKKIVHIDMDCFYAAVEMRDRPDLASKPLAVGGRPEGRGVITTCNYVARKYKVHSALSSREAVRRCPDLIILPNRFEVYRQESRKIRKIFEKYTNLIEPISLDEAFLDLSENSLFDGSASETAKAIRWEIFETTGLTASAGIANCKFLAKIASDWKKPNNQFTITPAMIPEFMKSLPVKKIPGVGKQTQKKMAQLKIETCLDLQKLSLDQLRFQFGSFGDRLYDLSRGVDHSKVKSSRQRKSISVENTFSKDLTEWESVEKQIFKLFDELKIRMNKAKIQDDQLKSMAVKFKFSDFRSLSKERSTRLMDRQAFRDLAFDHYLENNEPIRLIGIGFKLKSQTLKKQRGQLNLFTSDSLSTS